MKAQILKRIGSKALACLITALIIGFVLSFFIYQATRFDYFPIITLVVFGFGLLIGVPCSLLIDLIINKLKNKKLKFLLGMVLHLFSGLITLLLFIHNDETVNMPLFIYPLLCTAFGIWLFDSIIKKVWVIK